MAQEAAQFITVEVETKGDERVLRMLRKSRNPQQAIFLAGVNVQNELIEYHDAYNAAGRWVSPENPVGSTGQFGSEISNGWQAGGVEMESADTVRVTNLHPHLAQKIFGGTITAKEARYLTIPVSERARKERLRVGGFINLFPDRPRGAGEEAATDLARKGFFFINRGQKVLLMGPGESIDSEPVLHYVLQRSVHQEPWPGAMPPEDEIAQWATEGLSEAIRLELEQA